MIFWLQLFVSIVVLLGLYSIWTQRKYSKLKSKLPGISGFPFIGVAHQIKSREKLLKLLKKLQLVFGYKLLFWLGPFPFFLVSDPQIVQDILTSPQCVNKSFLYNAVEDATGRGLFTSKDPEWSVHRKLLNPAFGHKVLLSFYPIFNKEVNALLKTFDEMVGKGEADLMPILQKFTLNIASQTTMGKRISDENRTSNVKSSFFDAFQCVLDNAAEKVIAPWLNFALLHWLLGDYKSYVNAKRAVRQFVNELITERIEAYSTASESAPKESQNIFINRAIDLLTKGDLTWKNVEDEALVIVSGAFETTASTICYTLMLLAMFPQYQQNAFDEINTLFAESGEFDVSYADTQQMVYMDMVLNESMRVMATVPLIGRQAMEEVTLSNGMVLPKGVQIGIDIFNMHRREDIWGVLAHVFNPDNFLPLNLEGKHPYAFIPFTKGIRSCIGWRYALMSIKVAMAKLLRNYRFTTNFAYDDLHFVEGVTLKLKERPLLEIHRRES